MSASWDMKCPEGRRVAHPTSPSPDGSDWRCGVCAAWFGREGGEREKEETRAIPVDSGSMRLAYGRCDGGWRRHRPGAGWEVVAEVQAPPAEWVGLAGERGDGPVGEAGDEDGRAEDRSIEAGAS